MNLVRKRIKSLRKARGLSQVEISELLGISRSTYAHYEIASHQRVPETDTLVRLADLHGVTLDYLLGRTEDPHQILDEDIKEFSDDLNLELTDEELIKKYNLLVDGSEVSPEQARLFIALVRADRQMKDGTR